MQQHTFTARYMHHHAGEHFEPLTLATGEVLQPLSTAGQAELDARLVGIRQEGAKSLAAMSPG